MRTALMPLMILLAAAGEPPRPVRVASVVIAPVASQLVFSGVVQARTQTDLGFRVPGRVTQRPVEIGDHVKPGQLLALIDQADLKLAEESAEAALEAARADSANARADLARYDRLGRNSPAFLPSEADKRDAMSRMAGARVAQAARALSLARSARSYGELRAEADAVVTSLPVQIGQVVAAGQTVAVVANTAEIEVVADVPENRLADIRNAEDVGVALWAAPGQTLRGRVREIGALADPASRTFAVKVSIPDAPPNLLALGMTATVQFGKPGLPLARLPGAAITDQAGSPAVWVLDTARQRAALRPIGIAAYAGDGTVLVHSGLRQGDLVVTAGAGQITPDMPVVPWSGATR